MKKSAIVLILYSCCYQVAPLALVSTVSAAAIDQLPTITVVGTGEVLTAPNLARVDIGVVTQLESASASLQGNSDAMEKVRATLDRYNISENDVQTSNFSIQPQYDYDRSGQPPRLIGYRVTNEVRIVVRRIEDLGALIDAVVATGSNQINAVTFEIDQAESIEDSARRMAMSDAHRKASLYAQEARVPLGSVLRVEEISGLAPMPQMGITMAQEARAVPIAPGRQKIRQAVRVTFAIETGE